MSFNDLFSIKFSGFDTVLFFNIVFRREQWRSAILEQLHSVRIRNDQVGCRPDMGKIVEAWNIGMMENWDSGKTECCREEHRDFASIVRTHFHRASARQVRTIEGLLSPALSSKKSEVRGTTRGSTYPGPFAK